MKGAYRTHATGFRSEPLAWNAIVAQFGSCWKASCNRNGYETLGFTSLF